MHQGLDRRGLLAGTALGVGFLVALLVLLGSIDRQSPLSSVEERLIGEWSHDPAETARSFRADRSFSTSNGQFVGAWDIKDGRLTIKYSQPFELPTGFSAAALADSIRRTRTETLSWRIEIAADNQQLSLDQGCVLKEGRLIPIRAGDEKWLLKRVGNGGS